MCFALGTENSSMVAKSLRWSVAAGALGDLSLKVTRCLPYSTQSPYQRTRIWTIPQGQTEQPLRVHRQFYLDRKHKFYILISSCENLNPLWNAWLRAIRYVIGQIDTYTQARPPPRKLILKIRSVITPARDVKDHLRVWVYAGHASLLDRIRKGRQPAFWFPLVCIVPPYFRVPIGTKDSNHNARSVGDMNFMNFRAILSCYWSRQRDNDVLTSPGISASDLKTSHWTKIFCAHSRVT